jgi:prepilin-type N-terminal cleavage/methylation domain-containing protein
VSRTPDLLAALRRRLDRARGADEGFTLIEVVVSLTLFAVVSTAAGAMIITGLRTSMVSKLDTGAKNLAQERVEIMRNLPFHIDRDPAATTPDSSDLLDIYYRNTTAAANVTSTGYVAACGAQTTVCSGRAAYDPASGSFYRYVIAAIPGYPQYKQYVATQFVDANRNPLAPGTYDSQVSGQDNGPSQFVSATVTTYWTAGTLTKSFQVQTYISAGRPAAADVTLQGRASALTFSGGLDVSRLLTMQAGVVNLDGALAVGATSAAQAEGAWADISGSEHRDGGLASAQAPPNSGTGSGGDSAKDLYNSGVSVAHFGTTASGGVSALVTGGLPSVGSSASPVYGQVAPQGVGTTPVWFSNSPSPAAHLMLSATQPLMWVDQSTGSVPVAYASGYLTSTGGTSHSATTNVTAKALTLKMFSTSFAPQGVVQVTLTSSSLSCTTNGATGTVTPAYSASVSYWTPAGYVTKALDQTQSASPLAAVNLATTVVGTDSSGSSVYLGDYLTSWGSLTSSGVTSGQTVDADKNHVEASYDGLVTLSTTAMRSGDPTSTAGVKVGSLSCIAEDNR